MRILQFGGMAGPGPVAGGVWRVAETQANILRARGHEVHLFGLWLDGNPPADDFNHFLPARPPFPGAGYRGLLVRGLEDHLAHHGPYDIAHIHLARDYGSFTTMRWASRQGVPVVVQTHGMVSRANKATTKLYDLLAKPSFLRGPDLWLSLTDVETQSLIDFGAKNIRRIANPVLPSGLAWEPDQQRHLLFASRLHPRKRAAVLVRAVAQAREDCPGIKLRIAGPDEGDLAAVREAIQESGHPEDYELLGPLDQGGVRKQLAGAYAMLLSSVGEVAPMIAIESCEIGTPMVLTQDCGLAEALRDADAAEIRAPEVSAFAEAISKLWNSPERSRLLSQRAREHYAANWAPERVGEQLEAAYASIMPPQNIDRKQETMVEPGAKLPITVLVQTKNEAVGIAACLESMKDFDEVIVVDSCSTDATQAIASNCGARVVNFDWNGQYPKKKQWMIESAGARNDWLLIMDADERVTPEMLAELRRRLKEMSSQEYGAYEIPIDYVFNGRLLQHGHKVYKRTLVDRRRTSYPAIGDLEAPGMGELEGHYQPVIVGPIGRFGGAIHHDDKDPIRSWFERHNRYSDWEAYLATHPEVGRQVNQLRTGGGQKFAKVPFKPLAFFVYDYIVRQGFRDGRAGFNYAFALAWYYWLTEVKVEEQRAAVEARGETATEVQG